MLGFDGICQVHKQWDCKIHIKLTYDWVSEFCPLRRHRQSEASGKIAPWTLQVQTHGVDQGQTFHRNWIRVWTVAPRMVLNFGDLNLKILRKYPRVLTRVGVSEWGRKIFSIFSLVILSPFSNISRRASSIFSRRASLSFRTSCNRDLVSVFEPIRGILDLRSKHRRQGQSARYRRQAISILLKMLSVRTADLISVWKSGPVRSFGLESLGPGPRPVLIFSDQTKNRTEPVWTGPERFFAVLKPV